MAELTPIEIEEAFWNTEKSEELLQKHADQEIALSEDEVRLLLSYSSIDHRLFIMMSDRA